MTRRVVFAPDLVPSQRSVTVGRAMARRSRPGMTWCITTSSLTTKKNGRSVNEDLLPVPISNNDMAHNDLIP